MGRELIKPFGNNIFSGHCTHLRVCRKLAFGGASCRYACFFEANHGLIELRLCNTLMVPPRSRDTVTKWAHRKSLPRVRWLPRTRLILDHGSQCPHRPLKCLRITMAGLSILNKMGSFATEGHLRFMGIEPTTAK